LFPEYLGNPEHLVDQLDPVFLGLPDDLEFLGSPGNLEDLLDPVLL
jgi:hypothetical protein